MTPRELLNVALQRFQVVYLSPGLQESIVRQAIATYQAKVGPVAKVSASCGIPIPAPDSFLDVAVCLDDAGRWSDVLVQQGTLTVIVAKKLVNPFTIHYFLNLTSLDFETGKLPEDSASLLLNEYAYTLLAIPNTQRAREAMTATGIQMDLPEDTELYNRKLTLEEAMEESAAMIPMATVY